MLPIQHPEAAPFRVAGAANQKRRNDLFLKFRVMPMGNLFQFATIGDIRNDFIGSFWLSLETFLPYRNEYNEYAHVDNLIVLRERAHALLNSSPLHNLWSELFATEKVQTGITRN